MKTTFTKNRTVALTFIELLVIVAVLFVLGIMLLPAGGGNKARAGRINCVNNLKQVGLSFHEWALDHNNQFPMQVSMTNGGSMEFISRGGVMGSFLTLSNELNTPKILHCPDDKKRPMARSFTSNFTDSNISYFIGVDATPSLPGSFLDGDCNLTNVLVLPNSMLRLKTNSLVEWTDKIHEKVGNVGRADGSVQGYSKSRLHEALATTGLETNRLALPLY